MPVILLERLPLPNLSTYVTFSVCLLASAIAFSYHEVVQKYAERNDTSVHDPSESLTRSWYTDISDVISVLVAETWCIWTLINMVYCCLILVGKTIQNMVFGELRVSEQEHLRDQFWNFIFYKFIFIFGVMNVESMDDVLMWCAWFSVIGFLQFLAQLCKDRFEYLSFSPTTSRWTHIRVLTLLSSILVISFTLLATALAVMSRIGLHTSTFMAAECFLLILTTVFIIVKYGFHLYEQRHDGVWEKRAVYLYYTELIYDLLRLTVDFIHHLHMLVWGNIFLSMANLVICMQLRYLFYEGQRRIHRHKNYLRIVKIMEELYPTVHGEDIGENDQCAICWDTLTTAQKLPCGHLFHNSCLRSWLEQDATCPTCRCALADPSQTHESGSGDSPAAPPAQSRITNHFFQFDGSRYVSWLPTFSVEVTHTRMARGDAPAAATNASHLSQLAREVQSVFPHMPLYLLQEDLQLTHSVEATIDNILEGRVQAPPTSMYPPLTETRNSPPRPSPRPVGWSGRGFIQDDNLNALDDEEEEEIVVAPSNSFPFSKNPAERERMLNQRKKDLLEQSKLRFLARENDVMNVDDEFFDDVDDYDVDDDDVVYEDLGEHSPRELAYQAAERRRRHATEPE